MERMTIEEWYKDKKRGVPFVAGKQIVGVTEEEIDGYYQVETDRGEEFTLYRYSEVESCPQCQGRCVIPVIDEDNPALDKEMLDTYYREAEAWAEAEAEYRRERLAELRMGC